MFDTKAQATTRATEQEADMKAHKFQDAHIIADKTLELPDQEIHRGVWRHRSHSARTRRALPIPPLPIKTLIKMRNIAAMPALICLLLLCPRAGAKVVLQFVRRR